jgi:DNA repair exonuclease SbcCD nuclease subunit
MIISFFTDAHIKAQNSVNRIGDYHSDIIAKFKETLSIAKENKSPFILDGGDIIDSPIISTILCDEIIDLVEANGIPIYSLTGNHPLFGHSWELSKATTLAHIFRRSKFIKKLDILENEECIAKSFDYFHGIEDWIKENGLILGKKTKKWKIAIVHAFLTPKPFLSSVLHIPINQVETDADLVLCGHTHHPFNKIIDDVKFLNPGSVGRCDIDEADIEPSIVLLDTEKRSTKVIKLKSAKPKEEIFDLTKIQQIKNFENDIEKFIASLNTTNFTSLDLLGQIKEIGKKQKVDKEIIEEVENRIKNYKND